MLMKIVILTIIVVECNLEIKLKNCVKKYKACVNNFSSSVKGVLNVRLSDNEEGKLVSILELPGDVLVIPQATLGGRVKGKAMQYHANVEKVLGEDLYSEFVELCRQTVEKNPVGGERGCEFKWGTYGNRQVSAIDTNGPYTHILEF